jgi:molecular chaperone DnaJ
VPVEIPTIDGKVKIKMEPGTQPGKILRLRGKGLPEFNGYGKGDLLVNISVWVPKNLSREESGLSRSCANLTTSLQIPAGKTKAFLSG